MNNERFQRGCSGVSVLVANPVIVRLHQNRDALKIYLVSSKQFSINVSAANLILGFLKVKNSGVTKVYPLWTGFIRSVANIT